MAVTIDGSTGIDKVVPNTEVQQIGVNQTWQSAEYTDTGALFTDGTPSYRTMATTYTNNTGKPIMVSVLTTDNNNFFIGGVNVGYQTASGSYNAMQFIIPDGAEYYISGAGAGLQWVELR